MNSNPIIEMIKNKEVSILKTIRSRRCIECCITLNPGDRVHEIDCYRVDNHDKRHPLATRYMCEFCNTNDNINTESEFNPVCETSSESNPIIVEEVLTTVKEENNIKENTSFIDNILNWFKFWRK